MDLDNILQVGDIVQEKSDGTWGHQRFVICNFFGGRSWRMIETKPIDGNLYCNFPYNRVNLVDCSNRPFINFPLKKLVKLLKTKNKLIHREFLIRKNTKSF